MLSLFALGVALMSEVTGSSTGQNSHPIVIEETGVADSYEATKNISCGNVQWRVAWKSHGDDGPMRGTLSASISGHDMDFHDAQDRLFGRFGSIDSVSATCNPAKDGRPGRTTLLVLGYTLEDGNKGLAQVNLDESMAANWTFDRVD